MKTETLDQIKDRYYGKAGTPERDRIERESSSVLRRMNKKTEVISESQYEQAQAEIERLLPLVGEELSVADENTVALIRASEIVKAYETIHYPMKSMKRR